MRVSSSQPLSPFRQSTPPPSPPKKKQKQENNRNKTNQNKTKTKPKNHRFTIVMFDLCVFLHLSHPLLSDNRGQVHAMFLSCIKKKKTQKKAKKKKPTKNKTKQQQQQKNKQTNKKPQQQQHFTVLLSSCLTCACFFISATLSFQTTGARCTSCSCLA